MWPNVDLLGEPDAAVIALAAQEGGATESAEGEGGAVAGGGSCHGHILAVMIP